MVTLNTVLPTGRACVLSSVSTVAFSILIILFLSCVCVCVWYNDVGPSAHVSIGQPDVSAVHDVCHFVGIVLPVGVPLIFAVHVFVCRRVVVVCHDRIIPSSLLFVKLNRKVFYLPQGCRLASPTPIMARGIRIAASIAIVVMSIVGYPLPCCFVCSHYIYIIGINQPLS